MTNTVKFLNAALLSLSSPNIMPKRFYRGRKSHNIGRIHGLEKPEVSATLLVSKHYLSRSITVLTMVIKIDENISSFNLLVVNLRSVSFICYKIVFKNIYLLCGIGNSKSIKIDFKRCITY